MSIIETSYINNGHLRGLYLNHNSITKCFWQKFCLTFGKDVSKNPLCYAIQVTHSSELNSVSVANWKIRQIGREAKKNFGKPEMFLVCEKLNKYNFLTLPVTLLQILKITMWGSPLNLTFFILSLVGKKLSSHSFNALKQNVIALGVALNLSIQSLNRPLSLSRCRYIPNTW